MTEWLRSKLSDIPTAFDALGQAKSLNKEGTEQNLARGNQKIKAVMPKPKIIP